MNLKDIQTQLDKWEHEDMVSNEAKALQLELDEQRKLYPKTANLIDNNRKIQRLRKQSEFRSAQLELELFKKPQVLNNERINYIVNRIFSGYTLHY